MSAKADLKKMKKEDVKPKKKMMSSGAGKNLSEKATDEEMKRITSKSK